MVSKIYEVKNRVIEFLDHEVQEGSERIDIETVGMLADVVKDLAEAEEKCWESEYYRSVSEAMEKSGYSGYNGNTSSGYSRNSRSGWQNQYGSGYSRRGYSSGYQDPVEGFLMSMRSMNEEDKKHARERLISALEI